MVCTCPLSSKSSSPFSNLLMTVPSEPITIGITVIFMFHSLFRSLARSRYLSLFAFFQFYLVVSQNGKVHYSVGSIFYFEFSFFLTISWSGRLVEIRWSVCISKSQRILCVSFSRADFGLCVYYLILWSSSNFLHNYQWITFHTQSCLVFNSFCANVLYSLIKWLIVSSLSPHYLLLFCYVLSIPHPHHHHVVQPARISLTLSRHFSLSFIASGRSSGFISCVFT